MEYIIHENGEVVRVYSDLSIVPQEDKEKVLHVELPLLTEMAGKNAYHFWNGQTVEVRYRDRPLTELEQIEKLSEQLQTTNDTVDFLLGM